MPDASPENVTALVIAGGDPIDPSLAGRLPPLRYVIAADSGLDHARALGIEPDVVIGDLDSVDRGGLAAAMKSGVRVERHPPEKDATDLALALDHARNRGHRHVVLLGGGGGRLSHLIGNALAVAADAYAAMRIEWRIGAATVCVVRPGTTLHLNGDTGDLVSLLAVGGTAAGITTSGLRWQLHNEPLAPGSTRGISNEMMTDHATVALAGGVVLALHERTTP